MFNKSVWSLLVIFIIIAALILVVKPQLQVQNIDWKLLSIGNLFIYIITLISLQMLRSGLNAVNTQTFLRKAYSGILIKLFACAGAAFIYIAMAGKNMNKPGLFINMGFYLLYSFVEMRIILKQSNVKRNG